MNLKHLFLENDDATKDQQIINMIRQLDYEIIVSFYNRKVPHGNMNAKGTISGADNTEKSIDLGLINKMVEMFIKPNDIFYIYMSTYVGSDHKFFQPLKELYFPPKPKELTFHDDDDFTSSERHANDFHFTVEKSLQLPSSDNEWITRYFVGSSTSNIVASAGVRKFLDEFSDKTMGAIKARL